MAPLFLRMLGVHGTAEVHASMVLLLQKATTLCYTHILSAKAGKKQKFAQIRSQATGTHRRKRVLLPSPQIAMPALLTDCSGATQ